MWAPKTWTMQWTVVTLSSKEDSVYYSRKLLLLWAEEDKTDPIYFWRVNECGC